MTTKKLKGSSAAEFFEKSRGGPLTFGAALAGVRHVEGLTQVEFAIKLRVSTAHLCDLEKGRRFVSVERAAALAKRMGHPQAYWVKLAIQDQINHAGLKLKVEVVAAQAPNNTPYWFAAVYGNRDIASVDTQSPTIAITSPTAGATISNQIAIAVTAMDNVGIAKVEHYIDGNLIGTSTVAPYGISWDSKSVADGNHVLSAKAFDTSGNSATSVNVGVVVKNASVITPPENLDTTAPSINITSPTNGALVSRRAYVTIAASAQDNVSVTRVEFYVNGTLLCTDTSSPYNCSWKVPGRAGKEYNLSAKAYDSAGNIGTALLVKVRSQ